ncbi:MAG: hypothetical protein S0880_27345 [Actinomycetota bacterium]|nr:hypothetical protein [Actinomycetota bacterium]
MSTDAPPLATGWEPDAPVGDTMVRRYLFHWAAYCDAYAVAGGGLTVRSDAFALADLRRPGGYFNSVTLLQPPDGRFGRVLDEIDGHLAGGSGEMLLWSAWPVPGAELVERGWTLGGYPPVLIRPPATLLAPPAHPPVDVREIHDPAALADWERVAVEGYPMPELDPVAPGALADPSLLADERMHFFVGRDDAGDPVSIGTSFVAEGIGSFALGVTRPGARRRGHWMAHAAARLRATPDVWMTGVFSDFSRPGAERIGFVPILRLGLWARPRP